jgi:carbon storage regulator
MLVLSRGRGESVFVTVPPSDRERTIEVMAVEIRGDKARLGFEADRDITVHRSEVVEKIEREELSKPVDNPESLDIP